MRTTRAAVVAAAIVTVLAVVGIAPASAATTYTQYSLSATVSGTSVTASTRVRADVPTAVTYYGICVRDSAGGNQDFPNKVSTTINNDTDGTEYVAAAKTFAAGTYTYWPCLYDTAWRNIGATKTFTVASVAQDKAATKYGWGAITDGDEFNYTGAPDATKWSVYSGAGHAGNGTRDPANVYSDGVWLQMLGKPDGSGAGMSSKFDRTGITSGRWETRMRVYGSSTSSYRASGWHPVLIVWPDAGRVSANNCQELDYAEGTTADVTKVNTFLHYGCSNEQLSASQVIDQRQWHNYAVEWNSGHVNTYVDGNLLFSTTDTSKTPKDASHSTIQLDNFLGDLSSTTMQVDWTRYYAY
jgi:hypothetical protein